MAEPRDAPVRLDRWLWAARLARTRAEAAEAIRGGRVEVDGRAAKPSRTVGPGATVAVTSGPTRREVVVRATGVRRGSAAAAAELYAETAASRAAREAEAERRRLARAALGDAGIAPPRPAGLGRPTKRDRRRLDAARGRRA